MTDESNPNTYEVCMCGDSRDDHGHDPKHPGSTACCCDGCPCFVFEPAEDPGAAPPTGEGAT